MTTPPRVYDDHVYGNVNSIKDLREINREIRNEIHGSSDRDEITMLKGRSDYLCTLTKSPAWRAKFGSKIRRYMEAVREENRRTVDKANTIARQHKIDVTYVPWRD